MKKLTQERVKELLNYDPETGILTWKVNRNCVRIGARAGTINARGYRVVGVDYVLYKASRLAWLYMEGYFPEYECDHENRIRDDDRWDNIRHVSPQCNTRNRGRCKNNTSGITGVSWEKQKNRFSAGIGIAGKWERLGSFKRLINAVRARWNAELKYDWPGCNSHTDAYCYLHNEES